MKSTLLKAGGLTLMAAMYAFSAFSPATISAKATTVQANANKFDQEKWGTVYFIHITVADVLNNDPCHAGTNNIVCPI